MVKGGARPPGELELTCIPLAGSVEPIGTLLTRSPQATTLQISRLLDTPIISLGNEPYLNRLAADSET